MADASIYLDTNFFIYAFEGEPHHAVTHASTALLEFGTQQRTLLFSTSQITLAEMLVRPIREGKQSDVDRYRALFSMTGEWLRVLPVDAEVLTQCAAIRAASSLKLPDAIHLASALLINSTYLLTRDKYLVNKQTLAGSATEVVMATAANVEKLIWRLRS